MKINSHQLDESGTSINATPRYQKLIPNLAVLNANHHADKSADFAKLFPHSDFTLDRPPSYLRFFLACGGKNILDRNISEFCHDQFSQLKIRKLKSKKTQGLLWRILPLTSTSWETLLLYKGWFRSLLGLSSTHTRKTYKSEVYRECCKAKLLENITDERRIDEICKSKPNQTLKIIGNCLWCNKISDNPQKGNQNHALLFCSNPKITYFRKRILNLTEAKLKLFFLDLGKASSLTNVDKCIADIEKMFLEMQSKQTGRLNKLPSTLNNRYLTISDILNREGLENVRTATESSHFHFFSEILGLLPSSTGVEIKDDEIGLVDSTCLGLIPIPLENIINSYCNHIKQFIPHAETAMIQTTILTQSWNEIKNLIMGKVIGIHRIIGSTGKELEREWKEKYKIDINSVGRIKKESDPEQLIPSNPTAIKGMKRKSTGPDSDNIKDIKKKRQDDIKLKSCTGITCSQKYKSWYPTNNFSPNRIRTSITQCQRCSRFMTALKQCQIIFNTIDSHPHSISVQPLISFAKTNHNRMQNQYHPFFNILNKYLPSSSKIPVVKSKRVGDRFKLIGQISCTSIRKSTNHFTFVNETSLQRIPSILDKVISCKKSDFNLDKEAEVKIQLLSSDYCSNSSCNDKNQTSISTSKDPNPTSSPTLKQSPNLTAARPSGNKVTGISTHTIPLVKEKATTKVVDITSINHHENKGNSKKLKVMVQDASKLASMNKLKDFAAAVIRPNRCLPGINMTRAIEILRSYKTPNMFFASAESETSISEWRNNQGWKFFARIFASRELLDNKVNGIYLIPLFSGDNSSGHWHLCVVHKISQRNTKAWCIDSLGTGRVESHIARKIENAFVPGRGQFRWIPCTCKRQEELECGPRTILAMWMIQQRISNNVPVDDCIQDSTLTREPSSTFTPTIIREKIARLLNTFDSSMATAPIRLRHRTPRYRAPTNNEASRNPIQLE